MKEYYIPNKARPSQYTEVKVELRLKGKNNEHKNLAPYYHHTYQCEADLQSQFKTQFDQWQDYKIIHESALTQIPY